MFVDDVQDGADRRGAEEDRPGDSPLAIAERERDQMKTLAQRTQADFVNYKRRVEEERWAVARNASHHVIAKLLPIVDDLRRAVEALPEEAAERWGGGVRLILQNVDALLSGEGVVKFDPAPGDAFDPTEHEAVYHQPSAEHPAGCVVGTLRAGYRSTDRVLRPAQVVVARTAETPADPVNDEHLPAAERAGDEE